MKTVLNRWMPTDLNELIDALTEIRVEAAAKGHSADTVYVDVRDLALEEAVLSDNSRVINLVVRENR